MSDSTVLLDPTGERAPAARTRAARLASFSGATVGLLDIRKPRGDVFLKRVEDRLTSEGAKVLHFTKPTFTRIAPVDLRQEIATRCDAVVEALADCGSCTSCSVHDTTDLEGRGVPSVFVASTEFIDAAETQAQALGFDAARVFVPHPIQDRTDAEIRELADDAIEALRAALLKGATGAR
jgi:hypothetical protein